MKYGSFAIASIVAMSAALAGCQSTSRSDRALVGGGLGAATGAVVGSAVSGDAGGALAGAIIGGAAGAIIGAETTPELCTYQDAYGNYYRAACP